MRLLALILSLFILVLSNVPCTDNHEDEKSAIGLSSSHGEHDHEQDTCPPFCYCSCCGIAGIMLASHTFSIMPQTVQRSSPAHAHYHSNFVSSYFYSFWQPPKLTPLC